MARFLHLADVHLGYDRYDNPRRSQDFYWALQDVLQRYAIDAAVDFVLIAGDLFEHRHIHPATLNQAQLCLDLLREAHIPVLAIEGNHDHCPYGTKTSWLRYLSEWGYLILLEPDEDATGDGGMLRHWDPAAHRGGYIDLPCGVRVVGSRWYGAAAPQMIRKLAAALTTLPAGPTHTVMMFHHGLEGQISRYTGALRYEELLPLREAGVDYLALGHIHKNYTEAGWIFNPGALEANSVAEGRDQINRGVYWVELDGAGIHATLQQDYQQRPIVRLTHKADKRQSQAELEQAIVAQLTPLAQAGKTEAAIVELRIEGQIGFSRLDWDLRSLRDRLLELSQALIFLLKPDMMDTAYATYLAETGTGPPPRPVIERQVFQDLLLANTQYEAQADALTQCLIDLKEHLLTEESTAIPESDLFHFLRQSLICNPEEVESR
ncbi:metallophosphoesterase family protein [Trichothermofontia sp.]